MAMHATKFYFTKTLCEDVNRIEVAQVSIQCVGFCYHDDELRAS
jgi:hypothetical protein